MNKQDNLKHTTEKDIGLPGIFGIEALELLTEKLSQATGFSFTVIDYRGNPLTDGIICNRFCENHKDKRECAECQMTSAFAAAKSAIKCCPYLFACPLGLYSIAVPIIINDQYLGAIVGGRVRCLPEETEKTTTTSSASTDTGYIGGTAATVSGDTSSRDGALGSTMTAGGRDMDSVGGNDIFYLEEEYQALPLFGRKKMMAIGDLMFFMLREIGEKETMGIKLTTASGNQAQLEDLRRWNANLREELKKSELKHLRTHIHPQFLLNMFETVANYAILENAVHTEELIVDYASIIRYYLDDSAEFITLEDEFLQIERYLSVFKSKYENKFHYHINLDNSVKKVRFPALILFPLLGYVINYGTFSTNSRAVLFIDAENKGDQCQVTMQMENQARIHEATGHRTGQIMDEDLIRKQLSDTEKRLKYVYGDKYYLEMKPNLVTLRFPTTLSNVMTTE